MNGIFIVLLSHTLCSALILWNTRWVLPAFGSLSSFSSVQSPWEVLKPAWLCGRLAVRYRLFSEVQNRSGFLHLPFHYLLPNCVCDAASPACMSGKNGTPLSVDPVNISLLLTFSMNEIVDWSRRLLTFYVLCICSLKKIIISKSLKCTQTYSDVSN